MIQHFLVAELLDLIAIVGMETYQANWDWHDRGCLVYEVEMDHGQVTNVCMYYTRKDVMLAHHFVKTYDDHQLMMFSLSFSLSVLYN